MKKYAILLMMLLIGACSNEPAAVATPVAETIPHASDTAQKTVAKVYKPEGCACCDAWVDHLEKEGFQVETEKRTDMDKIKQANAVTEKLASCHTAMIGGYVIEGHVPAEDVQRLLKEKPQDIVGLSAPGMPMKSPGMQPEGLPAKNYDIIAFKKDGSTEVYKHY